MGGQDIAQVSSKTGHQPLVTYLGDLQSNASSPWATLFDKPLL